LLPGFQSNCSYQSGEFKVQTLTVLGMSQDLSRLPYKYLEVKDLSKSIGVIYCFTQPALGKRNAGYDG
jgi:hypothetical protein